MTEKLITLVTSIEITVRLIALIVGLALAIVIVRVGRPLMRRKKGPVGIRALIPIEPDRWSDTNKFFGRLAIGIGWIIGIISLSLYFAPGIDDVQYCFITGWIIVGVLVPISMLRFLSRIGKDLEGAENIELPETEYDEDHGKPEYDKYVNTNTNQKFIFLLAIIAIIVYFAVTKYFK